MVVIMYYNLRSVSKRCVVEFCKFCYLHGISLQSHIKLYELLSYSLNRTLELDTSEYNELIMEYGDDCVECLRKVHGVSKHPLKMGLCDRVWLSYYCKASYLALFKIVGMEECVNARNRESGGYGLS